MKTNLITLAAVAISAILGQSLSAQVSVPAPTGLVGWWPGDGNAKDLTGDDDGVPTSIGYASGQVGQAFRFVGTNSFVRVPNQPAFNAFTNVTLECWFLNDSAKPFQRLLTLTPDWVRLGLDDSSRPYLVVASWWPTNQLIIVVGSNPVTANTWHHIAGAYDEQSTRLYLDGALVAVQNAPSKIASNGAAAEVYINFFQSEVGGLIDEAAIYSRALTPAEVRSHFNAGSAGMAKAPVFSSIGVFFPGNARLSINGQAGKAVTIQSSSNLLDRVTLTTDPNLTGTVNFNDSSAGGFTHRFYRAFAK